MFCSVEFIGFQCIHGIRLGQCLSLSVGFMVFVWVYVCVCSLGLSYSYVLLGFYLYGYTEEERCASHKGPGRSCGGSICFSPPLRISLGED